MAARLISFLFTPSLSLVEGRFLGPQWQVEGRFLGPDKGPRKTAGPPSTTGSYRLSLVILILFLFFSPDLQAQMTESLRDAVTRFEDAWYSGNHPEARSQLGRIYNLDTNEVYRYTEEAEALILGAYDREQGGPVSPGAVDTLTTIYNSAIRHDGEKSYHWAVARALLLVNNTSPKDARRRTALQEVFYTSPLDCPLNLIEALLQDRMELCARGRITAPMLMKDWIAADQALTQRQVLHPAESDEAARLQIWATSHLLSSVPDCNSLEKTARQQLRSKDDPTLYEAWYVLLHLRNCSPSGLPDSLEKRVLLNNTDPRWFRIAANVSLNAGQSEAAYAHASRARDLETNEQLRAGDLVFMARVLAQQGQYAEARGLLDQATVLHPAWGEPYLQLADLYAGAGSSCKLSRFDQKAVYWAAIEMCLLARNVDPSTEQDANRRIFSYQKNMPTAEECSFRGLRPGDTYPLLCWMEITTTVKVQ